VRTFVVYNTVAGQEIYNFSSVFAGPINGVQNIIAVRGVSVIWGTLRYTLRTYGFSKYQAVCRNYSAAYLSNPVVSAQYGQGASGSFYMYPPPDQVYVTEWDCVGSPAALVLDSDVDVIPAPFSDAVQYFAAWKCLMALQLQEQQGEISAKADKMFSLYDKFIKRSRAFSQPRGVANWYGRQS
jgi:hypothetical protein